MTKFLIFIFTIEMAAGVGVGHGPLYTAVPQFTAQYEIGNDFRIGAGAGIRYAQPCNQYIIRNNKHERSFVNEFEIPVFLRVGYDRDKYFANIDAGYAIELYSFYGSNWSPGGEKAPSYNGLFFEPQVGMKLGRHNALALGFLFQQSVVGVYNIVESGNIEDGSYSVSSTVNSRHMFTPAITLRYAFVF